VVLNHLFSFNIFTIFTILFFSFPQTHHDRTPDTVMIVYPTPPTVYQQSQQQQQKETSAVFSFLKKKD